MKPRFFFVLLIAISVTTSEVSGRKWTNSMGRSIEAEFLEFKDGRVWLKREDGKVGSVPIEHLSEMDREFVRSQVSPPAATPASPARAKPTESLAPKRTVEAKTSPQVDDGADEPSSEREEQTIYKYRPKFNLPFGSKNVEVRGDKAGNCVKTLEGGNVASIGKTLLPDALGSDNIRLIVDPAIGFTKLAGLRFKSDCVLNIWKNGTVEVNAPGVKAEDDAGHGYVSKEVSTQGRRAIVMVAASREVDVSNKLHGVPAVLPTIGIQECSMFATSELKEETATLRVGAEISVVEQGEWAVLVANAEGKEGWVRRCYLCTSSELDRRKNAEEVPARVICIGAEEDGRTFFYGGTMPISKGQFAVDVGQAFWMDQTARGKTFTVGSHPLRGDPDVLFLYRQDGTVAKLPIWRELGDTATTGSKPRIGSEGTKASLPEANTMKPREELVEELTGRTAPLTSRDAGRASPSGQQLYSLLVRMIETRGANTIWVRSEDDADALETTLQLDTQELAALREDILAAKFYGPFATGEAVWQFLGDVSIGESCVALTRAARIMGLQRGAKVNISLSTDKRCLVYPASSTKVLYFDSSSMGEE